MVNGLTTWKGTTTITSRKNVQEWVNALFVKIYATLMLYILRTKFNFVLIIFLKNVYYLFTVASIHYSLNVAANISRNTPNVEHCRKCLESFSEDMCQR